MQLDLIVGSTTYSLTDGNPYSLESADGLAMPPVRRFARSYPGQDGYDDLGHVLEPRTITLSILFAADSHTQLDERRSTLARMFAPGTNLPLVLEVTRDDGEKRRLDVTASGLSTIDLDLAHRPGRLHRAQVTLRAADPVWYSATPGTVIFNAGAGGTAPWYLASYKIPRFEIFEITENPSVDQQWVNMPASDYFSPVGYQATIAFRGTVPTSSTVNYTAFRGTYDYGDIVALERLPSDHAEYPDQLYLHRYNTGGPTSRDYGVALGNYAGSVISFVALVWSAWSGDGAQGPRIYINDDLVFSDRLNLSVDWFQYNANLASSYWRPTIAGTAWPTMQYAWRGEIPPSFSPSQDEKLLALSRSMAGITEITQLMHGTLQYLGDYHEFPVITLTGPIGSPVVTNTTNNTRLDFTGSSISAGQSYTINLRSNALSVVDSGGTVRTGELEEDSDLSEWALWDTGNIGISVSHVSVGTAAKTQIVYRNRYVSY